MRSHRFRVFTAVLILVQSTLPAAWAWNAHGHRLVTLLALDGLPADAPEWLRDESVRKRIAFEASEPDRWRSSNSPTLAHENKPDHFLDVEELEQFGLTLETIPPLRYEYLRALAVSKYIHPEQVKPYDASKDPDRTKEWPGFLPYAIAEHYAKLQSAFNQVRVLERLKDPQRDFQLQQARENAIYHMGILSHFVADAAQPLHTTQHFNGWVGENPGGYTTSDKFHAYIDGGVLAHHHITYELLKPDTKFDVKLNARDPWKGVLEYVRRSNGRVETTYQLEKNGDLRGEAGKAFICECLRDGATTLAALYEAAWKSAAPNEKQVADFVYFDERDPRTTTQPAGQQTPAGSSASQPSTGAP